MYQIKEKCTKSSEIYEIKSNVLIYQIKTNVPNKEKCTK